MPRWLRVLRGMIGTGLTFSVGVGIVASLAAGVATLLGAGGGNEMIRVVVASAIWAFPIGVLSSGVLALTAAGKSFEKLSLPRFAAIGGGAGLLAFGLLALNAWDAWTVDTAIANAAILVLLGSGAATGTLLVARRASPALRPGDEPPSLEDGGAPKESTPAP